MAGVSPIVTRGFLFSIALIVTAGYDIGTPPPPPISAAVSAFPSLTAQLAGALRSGVRLTGIVEVD
jgi:hypothetical protein